MKCTYLFLAVMLMISVPALGQPKPDGPTPVPATKVAGEQPASQPATADEPKMPDGVPKDAGEAVDTVKQGIEFAKAKNWWGLSAVCIFILMFILKVVGVFKKVGKRWAYVMVPALSLVAMLLSKFAGGLSWGAAIAVLTSGPAMAALSDLVKRGILGKEPSTPVKIG